MQRIGSSSRWPSGASVKVAAKQGWGRGLCLPARRLARAGHQHEHRKSTHAGASPGPSEPPEPVEGIKMPEYTKDEGNAAGHAATEAVAAAAAAAADPTAGKDTPPAPTSGKNDKGGVPHRWQVVGMIAVAFILCNMDKVNMSVAVIPMAQELGWSGLERGLVSSSFFWGYMLTQASRSHGWVVLGWTWMAGMYVHACT